MPLTTWWVDIATVITGNAEVNDVYIQYGALDIDDVNQLLRSVGIIVRAGELP